MFHEKEIATALPCFLSTRLLDFFWIVLVKVEVGGSMLGCEGIFVPKKNTKHAVVAVMLRRKLGISLWTLFVFDCVEALYMIWQTIIILMIS